jgi:RNA polymerase sigma-70 factor (ECF subfamily)
MGWRAVRNDAFERLYAAHAHSLLAFFVYRTSDRALAEDLLADTFERVLSKRRRFDPRRGSEKTWIYTIALNVLRDHLRHAAAGERALERVRSASVVSEATSVLETVEQRDLLQRALAVLSAEERETVALRYGADLTVEEIAKLVGEKPSTVHGRVYRGLRKLKRELD